MSDDIEHFKINSSNFVFKKFSKEIESKTLKRYLHTHTHYSIIHNSQEVEAKQMSMYKQVDKEIAVYTY